ncbi:hypothetical protein [Streptomyces sp. NBC_01435]|uniref:hypothetical protein n=1 Tax=Streptomyces sp. NBC_01435 TaxID=2903865 RepID=UPI002E36FFF2|nr:hypothetical protein [Streptomyces sp. NBC_01435]
MSEDLGLDRIRPEGMGTPAGLPRTTELLTGRGHGVEDTAKVLGENLVRSLAEVWDSGA